MARASSSKGRSRVPATLHAELTEYASLVRALRTSHTLDLSVQLTQHSYQPSAATPDRWADGESEAPIGDEEDDERLLGSQRTTSPFLTSDGGQLDYEHEASSDVGDGILTTYVKAKRKEGGRRRRESTGNGKHANNKDVWTRWPLLAGDVHVPAWPLEEEVGLIASQILKQQLQSISREDRRSHTEVSNVAHDEAPAPVVDQSSYSHSTASRPSISLSSLIPTPEPEAFPTPFTHALTACTSHALTRILAILAHTTPHMTKSLRSRVAPVGWTGVLAAVGASDLFSAEALQRTQARLKALYGVSSSSTLQGVPSDRAALTRRSRVTRNQLIAKIEEGGDGELENALFTFYGPSSKRAYKEPLKRRRRRKKIQVA